MQSSQQVLPGRSFHLLLPTVVSTRQCRHAPDYGRTAVNRSASMHAGHQHVTAGHQHHTHITLT